jgi:LuxR family quorum-sensing system transcriptional regulator SolR
MKNTIHSQNLMAFKYAETVSSKIKDVCLPLFLNFGFTIFAYIKVFPDGKMLHLNSDQDWTKLFFENEFYNEDDCFHNIRSLVMREGDRNFILSGNPQGKHVSTLFNNNIWNTYSIYKKRKNYVEGWAFGTTRDNLSALDFYRKHPMIFNLFTLYFNEKAFDFTCGADDRNLIHTEKTWRDPVDAIDDNLNDFFSLIFPKRFPINFKGKKVVFSRREIECLGLMATGYSSKEASKLLEISLRTIESHIDKMKRKLNVNNKNELIRMYLDNFDSNEINKIYKNLIKT